MILSSMFFAISMNAAPYQGPDPVRLLFLDGSSCKVAVSQKLLTTDAADLARLDADRTKALADLKAQAPAAIKSAGDSADLGNAIKSFYAAAVAYCENPSDSGAEEYRSTKSALDMKLSSAGR